MKQKILNILNEFAMKVDNHEEVITESSFEGLADELVKIVSPFEARVSPTEPNDGEIKRFISSQKQLDPDIISLLNEFDELTGKRKPSRDRFI